MTYKLGDRLKARLPRYVGLIPDMSDLFQAEDREFEKIDQIISDFEGSLSVLTVKDTSNPEAYLRLIERDYQTDPTGSIQERIGRVIAKMRGGKTANLQALYEICNTFGYAAELVPMYEKYALKVVLTGSKDEGQRLIDALYIILPAHIVVNVEHASGNRLILVEGKARAYRGVAYKTGTNRHKTGTIYRYVNPGGA